MSILIILINIGDELSLVCVTTLTKFVDAPKREGMLC